MSAALDVLTTTMVVAFALIGAVFFTAGTVGLLRMPDLPTRLHTIAKADTLGLGFVMLALSVNSGSLLATAKFLLIWILALVVAAVSVTVLAGTGRSAASDERRPDPEAAT